MGDPRPRSRREIEELAHQTLVTHDLLTIPVNPVAVARRLGARVVHAVFAEPKYSGIVARRNGEATILVKESDHPLRKRFTVAHEIGHLQLHLSDSLTEIIDTDTDFFRTNEDATKQGWTAQRVYEFEANAFAAGLLMPAALVRRAWSELEEDDRSLDVLAQIFQVSSEAMGIRLDLLKLT